MHCIECMTGYTLLHLTYMYHFVHLVTFLNVWLHSCMLGYMYHYCRFGFKYCSFMLDYMFLCMCMVGYALPMHVNVFMWSSVQ